jgi:ATP-dependent Lhr-like helicase
VSRAGHQQSARSQGLLLAATPAELADLAITTQAARGGQVEPIDMVRAPLDVLCQQLIGMSCAREHSTTAVFELVQRAGPMATLTRADFDACLNFLAGKLSSRPGARESSSGTQLR